MKHSNWLNSLKFDTEKLFFDHFDKNLIIQEALRRLEMTITF